MTDILINGKNKATISIFDRGLQYGDGVFETMAACNGKIDLWELHWQRLTQGCKQLSISLPNKDVIEQEITSLFTDKDRCVIKLIVTRGEGQRGYRFSSSQQVTRIITRHPWPDYPRVYQDEGVVVRYCETILSENEKLAGIKHLNRLEQILARNEWDAEEFQEGLMLTTQGHVVDGTMSNIFAVKDNVLITPDLSLCGVLGVMRKNIIILAKQMGLSIFEKKISKSELEMADELFLTNSLFGIWPIKILAETRFLAVGRVTKLLQEKLVSR